MALRWCSVSLSAQISPSLVQGTGIESAQRTHHSRATPWHFVTLCAKLAMRSVAGGDSRIRLERLAPYIESRISAFIRAITPGTFLSKMSILFTQIFTRAVIATTKTPVSGWGGGAVMPEKKRIEPISKDNPGWKKCGGKSLRTKNIRSATPRGFAKAWKEANS